MTIKKLKWKGSRQFREVPTGEYRKAKNGKMVRVTKGEEYIITTGYGEMLLDKWYKAMEEAVVLEGKIDLLEKIIEHCRKLAWLRTETAIREHALECLSGENYKAWEEFQ